MLSGVIFDFDGVIVDTEPLHFEAFQLVLAASGLNFPWEEYEKHHMGSDDRDAFRDIYRNAGRPLDPAELPRLIAKKAAVFVELASSAKPFDGVVELIRAASAAVPTGLCSGAVRSDIEPVIARLDIARHFRAVVTAEDVHASKPDPACYRLCLEKLGVRDAAGAVAVEDTPAGIAAAKGAGLKVLAVTNSYPPQRLSGADLIVRTLHGVDIATLASLTS